MNNRDPISKTEYNRIHKWLSRTQTKAGTCFYCEKATKTQWSNIDHRYRQDPTEYQEVCSRCHILFDREVLGVKFGNKLGQPRTETWLYYNPLENFLPD